MQTQKNFHLKSVIHPSYISEEKKIDAIITDFATKGEYMSAPKRNAIKIFTLGDEKVAVKSFKIPNTVNKIAYRFFRKSKAERSYTYANKLIDLKIGTPKPIAYFEEKSSLTFKRSYYICENLATDFTYRELINDDSIKDTELILREFTKFTHDLHENKVLFKDHSPGNTLIKKIGDTYHFYLVDLNRMEFKNLSFDERMQNFSRLTPREGQIEIMSDEYAKITGLDYLVVFTQMWKYTAAFQEKFFRKKRWKKRFKLG